MIGNLVLESNGALRLRNASTTIGSASPALTVGTLYRVGLRQKRGTGGDGVLEASLAEGSAAFGSPFASSNTETFTTAADRLRFGATVGVAIDAWFDDVKLNSQSMPQANAAPGIVRATASLLTNLLERAWNWLQTQFQNWFGRPEAAAVQAQVPAGQIWRSYYFAGSQRIALRVQTSSDPTGQVSYLLSDHLGSTTVTTNSTGSKTAELRYSPWGGTRYSSGSMPTDYRYTGQRSEESLGIYYFNARWYDSALGRFLTPDSIIPQPGNPLDWDRYAYVRGNPIRYNDPSGHSVDCAIGEHGCRAGKVTDSPEQEIDFDDLEALTLSVWIESSMGVQPIWAMGWISNVSINRFKNYYSKSKGFVEPLHDSLYGYVASHGGSLSSALDYVKNNFQESFDRVGGILMDTYKEYLWGNDPTNGATFFVHATKDNTGVPFNNTQSARDEIERQAGIMASNYTYDMAKSHGQIYPFSYRVSQPYTVDGQGEMFLFVGNHLCVAATSCNRNWLTTLPPQ